MQKDETTSGHQMPRHVAKAVKAVLDEGPNPTRGTRGDFHTKQTRISRSMRDLASLVSNERRDQGDGHTFTHLVREALYNYLPQEAERLFQSNNT